VNRIGSGSYGQVFRALCTRQNAQVEAVAVKVLDLEDTPCDIEEIFKEVHLLSMLQHKNITTYHAVFVSHHVLFIVMPLLSGGSCLSLMRATRPDNRGFEDESVIATILREVLTGLRYVHDNGIIHRDIKADNVLVSADGAISLADFGNATVYASSLRSFAEPPVLKDGEKRRAKVPCKNRHYSFVGTPCWMAPEVGSGFLQAMTERLHFTDGAATIVDASRNLPADVYLHMAPTSRLPTEFEATSPSQSIAPVDDQLVMSIVEPEAENSIASLVDSHM
jgi:serine/threonine protein kinase